MLHAAATFDERANGLLPTFGPVRSAHPESVVRNVSASLDPVVVQLGLVRSLKQKGFIEPTPRDPPMETIQAASEGNFDDKVAFHDPRNDKPECGDWGCRPAS